MAEITIQQAFDLGVQHHQAGRLGEAEELYRRILDQQPEHFDAIRNLAMIARHSGRNDLAVDLIRRAIALRPDDAEIHSHLGIALAGQGQLDDAIAAFRHANVLNPNYPEAHNNLGIALAMLGQFDAAIAAYRQSISLRPNFPKVYVSLGNALKQKGILGDAISAYRQAITFKPDYAEAYFDLGIALKEIGQLDEAVAAFRQTIAINPNYVEAHTILGNALKDKGQLDEAIAAYRQAVALRPDFPEAHSSLILAMHYHPGYDAAAIAGELGRWNRRHAEPLRRFIQPHSNSRDPDRPLRIGYVSPDFHNHPVGHNLLALFDHHDRRQFEITCYANVLRPDAMTARFQQKSERWRDIAKISDEEATKMVRDDGIDILVDLALHTGGNRLLIFARKPAPVQVTYLGYPGSTGLSMIDYRLSDPYLDPPDTDLSCYSETTIRLPRASWCYPLHEQSPEIRQPRDHSAGEITFGCLNNFCKVRTGALNLWIRLLAAMPKSRLILLANEGDHRRQVGDLLEHHGIDRARLAFVSKLSWPEYMALYEQIDVALDPFPFGGGATTCDALWMGVPVVTLSAETAVGRGGGSILSNLGLTDLIAFTPDRYVQIATDLANDFDRLDLLRRTLRPRMRASPIMDGPGFARDIESAYRQMWRTWCESAS